MKTVLVLASTFPRWKNDTTPPFVLELEKRLAKKFSIFVLAPHYPGAKKKETMEGLQVLRFQYFWPELWQKLCYDGGILPNLKKNKLLLFEAFTFLLFEFVAAAKLIRREHITLIHAHWIIPQGIIALLLYKLFRVPYIVTTHGGDIYGLQNGLLMRMKKQVLQNAKTITVVSTAIKDEIHKKISKDLAIEVISMGVDTKLFHPDKYDKTIKKKYDIDGPFLLFVGRLAEKKGARYLIEAMPDVIKTFPKAKLLIVGEGTLHPELEALVRELNLSDNIIFTGPIANKDLPQYYATANIFIGPSITTKDGDTEGLGLTFIEASLSGSIPIGTHVGGISDVIKNTKTGFLMEEKNPHQISNIIIRLLRNTTLMKELQQNARNYCLKTFDWGIVQKKYAEVYIRYI